MVTGTVTTRISLEQLREMDRAIHDSLQLVAKHIAIPVTEIEWDGGQRFSALFEDGSVMHHGPDTLREWLEF